MAIWVMRGGSVRGVHEDEFVESGTIGIYFGVDGDAHRPSEMLRQEISEHCLWWNSERGLDMDPSVLEGVVTRFLNQTRLFRDSVQPDDTVLMPRKRSGGHALRRGVIDGAYEFRDGGVYPHRRRVRWERTDVHRGSVPYSWSPNSRQTIIKVG